jgi:hypothetical protein
LIRIPNLIADLPLDTLITRLRPRTVGELIDGAFRLYRRHFRTFLVIVAVVYLPLQLLDYLADVFLLGTYDAPDGEFGARRIGSQMSTFQASYRTYLLTYFGYFAAWPLTVAVARILVGDTITVREAYREAGHRMRDLLGLIGLQLLILFGAASPLLVTIPAIALGGSGALGVAVAASCLLAVLLIIYSIIQVRLQVILPAAVNEDLSPRQALRRSWELTDGYWWRTVALAVVLGILNAVVVLGPATLLAGIVNALAPVDVYTNQAIIEGVGIITTIIFLPVEITAIALYYYDQRVRKEGFDLDEAITRSFGAAEQMDYTYTPAADSAPEYEDTADGYYDEQGSYHTYADTRGWIEGMPPPMNRVRRVPRPDAYDPEPETETP